MSRFIALLICALAPLIGHGGLAYGQSPPSYEVAQAERSGTTRYIVRPGDTLYSIARNAGVPVSVILDLNPGLDPRYIAAGDIVLVPGDFVPLPRERLTFSPQAGPPSTLVELSGHGFRPRARLRLLVGRTAYDLRRYSIVRADRRGRVLASVELPVWARPGRRVHFALQSLDGRSRAVAGPFRVIDRPSPKDRLTVTGTLIRGGVECPLLRGDNGRVYSLTGDLGEYGVGDRVEVAGRLAEVSVCMQGPTLQVRRISEAD
jgi:LysM repeat protein